MAKLYIFGIGGTGSRVLRSLSMLLAAGVNTNGYEIVPIIIDPDLSNGDKSLNENLLDRYISICDKLNFTDENKNKFFKTRIKKIFSNFFIPIQDTSDKTFTQFIGIDSMSRENRAMAEMLFSEKNLTSSMNVGFKGNPNIGSVVLNQIANSSQFEEFANSFVQGDKIFIISSIFGGTGASGFPLLLKTLRQNKEIPNSGIINAAEIGAISVLPYFNLKTNEKSEIDSSTFFSKTRAALKYYEKNVSSANALYYIGDIPKAQYENNEGGTGQKNKAHLIEVLASTAIIDFCNNSFGGQTTSYLELGLNNAGSTVTLRSFPPLNMQKEYAYPLIEFTLLAKSLIDDFNYVSSDKLKANKNLKKDIYNEPFVRNLRDFLTKYKEWLNELKDNSPSFFPFNMENDLKNIVTDIVGKESFWSRFDDNTFRSALNEAKPKGTSSDEDKFMEIYAFATDKIKNKYIL